MKTYQLLIALFLFPLLTSAQVSERSTTMSLGNKNAFTIDLNGSDRKMTEKLWKNYLKPYGKVERNKKAKEYYVNQTKVPAIPSNGPITIYGRIDEGSDMSSLTVWVDNGVSFISSDEAPSEANGVEVFLTNFSYLVQKEVIGKELEEEEKRLKNFNKDLGKLEKKNKGYHEDIENANKKIAEAESNIEKNLLDQDAKREEIAAQEKMVESVKERLNNVGKEN